MLGINGKDGSEQTNSKSEAMLKAQQTNHVHVTNEFRRNEKTKKRGIGHDVMECISVIIGCMNRFVNRVSKASMSRFMHTPTRAVPREDGRSVMDLVAFTSKDPFYRACQHRWRLRHWLQFQAEKCMQATTLPQPTMFAAEILLRAWTRRLEELNVKAVSNDIRAYEQLMTTARNLTIVYASHMGFNSALSRIRDKMFEPSHFREIGRWLFCTEDICIAASGICADLYSNPVEVIFLLFFLLLVLIMTNITSGPVLQGAQGAGKEQQVRQGDAWSAVVRGVRRQEKGQGSSVGHGSSSAKRRSS